jgi:hypothetical protein
MMQLKEIFYCSKRREFSPDEFIRGVDKSLSLSAEEVIDCAGANLIASQIYTAGSLRSARERERSNCGIRSSESRRVFVCIHARHAENRINQLFCGEPRLIIINLNVCCGGCCWADGTLSATAAARNETVR